MSSRVVGILWALTGLVFLGWMLADLFFGGAPTALAGAVFVFLAAALYASIVREALFVFLLKRLGQAALTILVIASLCFVLLRTIPGGPFDQEKALPPEIKANIEAKYGLDKPLYQQYLSFVGGLIRGDLGESYKFIGRGVTDIIKEALPVSFKLGVYAMMIALLLGIPLGLIAASHHNKFWDRAAMIVAVSGVSVPSFVAAAIFLQIFAFGKPLDLLFPEMIENFKQSGALLPSGFWVTSGHYILPVVILGIRPAAVLARLVRASALEVIQSDFIRTARSKGLNQRVILYKHVLKNSLIPALTYLGPLFAGVLSGAFVIETIFAVPGLGKHFIQSAFNRDYPLILGLTILFSALLIASNLLVDIFYRLVDPRMEVN